MFKAPYISDHSESRKLEIEKSAINQFLVDAYKHEFVPNGFKIKRFYILCAELAALRGFFFQKH